MKKITIKIIFLSIVLLSLIVGLIYLISWSYFFSSIVCGLFVALVFYEIINSIFKILSHTQQNLEAIANEDYSLKISNKNLPPGIYKPLNKIYETNKTYSQESNSTRLVFERIIDSVDTGILILRSGSTNEIEIFYSNMAFSNLLEIPRYSRWDLLAPNLDAFKKYLELRNWKDVKDVINLSINHKEQVYSFRAFYSKVYEEDYLIVNIDPLQNIVDKKEKEAWYNLMKVMSHEILNTITPINSLSNNLEYLIDSNVDKLGEDFEDIQKSVLTIKNRTKHLIDFVDTYRALTELPTPKKEHVKIFDLIENSLDFLKPMLKEKNIRVNWNVKPENLYFQIDRKQIEQVLINLLTNSVYALENVEDSRIEIKAYQANSKNCLEVIDNGIGIDPKFRRDIFVPFFTTRKSGSGIGLSLSKNIIQSHGGQITLSSEVGLTRFMIQFEI